MPNCFCMGDSVGISFRGEGDDAIHFVSVSSGVFSSVIVKSTCCAFSSCIYCVFMFHIPVYGLLKRTSDIRTSVII